MGSPEETGVEVGVHKTPRVFVSTRQQDPCAMLLGHFRLHRVLMPCLSPDLLEQISSIKLSAVSKAQHQVILRLDMAFGARVLPFPDSSLRHYPRLDTIELVLNSETPSTNVFSDEFFSVAGASRVALK